MWWQCGQNWIVSSPNHRWRWQNPQWGVWKNVCKWNISNCAEIDAKHYLNCFYCKIKLIISKSIHWQYIIDVSIYFSYKDLNCNFLSRTFLILKRPWVAITMWITKYWLRNCFNSCNYGFECFLFLNYLVDNKFVEVDLVMNLFKGQENIQITVY